MPYIFLTLDNVWTGLFHMYNTDWLVNFQVNYENEAREDHEDVVPGAGVKECLDAVSERGGATIRSTGSVSSALIHGDKLKHFASHFLHSLH